MVVIAIIAAGVSNTIVIAAIMVVMRVVVLIALIAVK